MKIVKLIIVFMFCRAALADDVTGKTFTYTSPNGVSEVCKTLDRIPAGEYSKKDLKKELKFCSVDFYSDTVALCPKTWSTSPATMVRDLSESAFKTRDYLASSHCGDRRKRKGEGVSNIAKFKTSMNQGSKSLGGGTSGTYSPSSLAYYHLSRYFDMRIKVPVSVYRELDRLYHAEFIAPTGLKKSKGSKIRNGWNWLNITGEDPQKYSPSEEFVTKDLKSYYGVLIKGPGERYGPEINGRRTRSWGLKQHQQMSDEVAPFIALTQESSLLEAVKSGLKKSKAQSSEMSENLGEVSTLQMVSWMRELSEMVLLDTIFGQQDRVGNIDYRWYWAYTNLKGKTKYKREKRPEYKSLSRERMAKANIELPQEGWLQKIQAGTKPILIQRTHLNDNDAGVRNYSGYKGATVSRYASFPGKAAWLQKLRHFDSKQFLKVFALNTDFQAKGPIYQWALNNLGMNDKSLAQMVTNTQKVAEIMKANCSKIKFDLDSVGRFVSPDASAEVAQVDCSAL